MNDHERQCNAGHFYPGTIQMTHSLCTAQLTQTIQNYENIVINYNKYSNRLNPVRCTATSLSDEEYVMAMHCDEALSTGKNTVLLYAVNY